MSLKFTLIQLHEIVYEQNLDDGIAQRTQAAVSSQPHINIIPYTSIISASVLEECPSTGILLSADKKTAEASTSSFVIVTQNLISRAISETKYDIVICATGYQRSAWIDILKSSDVGNHFGLRSASSAVELLPSSRRLTPRQGGQPMSFDMNSADSSSETSSPMSMSNCSTPPTSPGPSTFSPMHIDNQIPDTVYISRNYQLLPIHPGESGDSPFKPRIYLQGVEEATHGLSDTLLSVLGVRAGEVVADLCSRED
jgi:L-ornithine N5-oxygenase